MEAFNPRTISQLCPCARKRPLQPHDMWCEETSVETICDDNQSQGLRQS
jgi:hypothetical protein